MNDTKPPVDRHVLRAEVMAGTGARRPARLYLASLVCLMEQRARGARGNLYDHHRAQRGRRFDDAAATYRAAMDRLGLAGIGAADDVAELARAEAGVDPVALTRPTIEHKVRSAYWPGLSTHGLWICCDDRTASKRGLWLECQIHVPDAERSDIVLGRRLDTVRAAIDLAGRWAALGFAVLAGEDTLQAREGVVLAPAAAPSSDGGEARA